MLSSMTRRQFAFWGLGSLIGASAMGCGTIMHPERKGQPAGDLDWSIVALDGIGLLLFLVPGVIAFAVDFNNGSIYLPAAKSQATSDDKPPRKLISVKTNSRQLTHASVEHAIAQHAGRQIQLIPGHYETHQLDHLDQFWDKHDQLKAVANTPT